MDITEKKKADLVTILAEYQLEGKIEIDRTKGTSICIKLNLNK